MQELPLLFRQAQQHDIESLVAMLVDDPLGQSREDASMPVNQCYVDAFTAIESDPNNELVVVVRDQKLVGMLQLTFIPYLSHKGAWRCLIESVRIASAYRGQGLGTRVFQWAIRRAKERDCRLVQLTSDKQRPQAIKFYESLGFRASHEGFKLKLD